MIPFPSSESRLKNGVFFVDLSEFNLSGVRDFFTDRVLSQGWDFGNHPILFDREGFLRILRV